MILRVEELLRRFLLHVLPRGFMRIRHYGLLANCPRAAKLARRRALLGAAAPHAAGPDDTERGCPGDAESHREPGSSPCLVCGQPMRVVEILAPQRHNTSSAAQLCRCPASPFASPRLAERLPCALSHWSARLSTHGYRNLATATPFARSRPYVGRPLHCHAPAP